MTKRLKIPTLGTPKTVEAAAKVEGLRGRMIDKRISSKKRIRSSTAARGGSTADLDRQIRLLEEKAKSHKSDARTRVGGGSPGSFVAGGLARKGR